MPDMLEREVDTLMRTEVLLFLTGSRRINHVQSVMAASLLRCDTVMLDWLNQTFDSPTAAQADIFPAVVVAEVLHAPFQYDLIALGESAVQQARDWFDPSAINHQCQKALEAPVPPTVPDDLPRVQPLTRTRLEYGVDASVDKAITPQLRARIVARSFALRMWTPINFGDRQAHERFVEWSNREGSIREALESVASGEIHDGPEMIVATMVHNHHLSEIMQLIDTDSRILTAFAHAAADPKSLTMAVRRGMTRLLQAHYGCKAAQAREMLEMWAKGECQDPELSLLCTQFREDIEVAQTYRGIAA